MIDIIECRLRYVQIHRTHPHVKVYRKISREELDRDREDVAHGVHVLDERSAVMVIRVLYFGEDNNPVP